MSLHRMISIAVLAAAASAASLAADPVAPAASAATTPKPVAAAASAQSPSVDFSDWAVGMTVIHPSKHGVSDASIVNGVVRAGAETSNETMVLVARHFYPWRPGKKCDMDGITSSETYKTCVGLMVGVGLGSSSASGSGQIVNFAGIGLTFGGSPLLPSDSSAAWHLGIGIGRRFNMTVLGDGFDVNAPPPPGETQIRYKKIDVKATFFYFTTHW